MGLVPPVLIVIASTLLLASLLVLVLAGASSASSRSAAMLGLKQSLRRRKEVLTRSLPIALVVSVLFSALSVGDGLEAMVERNVGRNLSKVDAAVLAPSFVDENLIGRMGPIEGLKGSAPVTLIDGTASAGHSAGSVGVTVIGAEGQASNLLGQERSGGGGSVEVPSRLGCNINEVLAEKLGVERGDWLRISIGADPLKGGTLLGLDRGERTVINLTVQEVIMDTGIGRYREDAMGAVEPICVVNGSMLGERLSEPGMVNRILLDLDEGADLEVMRERLDSAVGASDAGYELVDAPQAGGSLLVNSDLFFEPDEALPIGEEAVETLSYFVDSISSVKGSLSYSVVSGMTPPPDASERFEVLSGAPFAPGPGDIVLNNWTAEVLDAGLGDPVTLHFRTLTDLGTLVNRTRSFTVRSIINMTGAGAEMGFLPPIEGITEAGSCSDWSPSFDVDLSKLTGNDYDYWELYRTTPKAFISLQDARELWSVVWGDTTAVWFPRASSSLQADLDEEIGLSSLRASLVPLRENALSSSRAMTIFPAMFSTFGVPILIGAALVLMAVDRDISLKRAEELGILRSVGARRRLLFITGAFGSFPGMALGGLLGLFLGSLLAAILNIGLSNIWSRTVEGVDVPFALSADSAILSLSLGLLLSLLLSLVLTARFSRDAPVKNTRGEDPSLSDGASPRTIGLASSVLLLVLGAITIAAAAMGVGPLPESASFVLGCILLSGGSALLLFMLPSRVRDGSDRSLIVSANLRRRPLKHPLSVVMLAFTLSLVIGLTSIAGMMRSELDDDWRGYGGSFDYLVETAVPLKGDVDALLKGLGAGTGPVPVLSVGKEGGTCSNMNAPYPPRLLGVPDGFGNISEFKLSQRMEGYKDDRSAWAALGSLVEGKVPILVDSNTLQWIYGKGLSDTFTLDSEDGKEAGLLVIGVLSPSVLTGTFVMSWGHLKALFPSLSDVNLVLARSEGGQPGEEMDAISTALSEYSPRVSSVRDLARENLDAEMSYLALFRDLVLLGLFVAMASSLVFIHARTHLIRRELASMRAIGAGRQRVMGYIVWENSVIFITAAAGAAIGSFIVIAAFSGALRAPVSWEQAVSAAGLVLLFLGASLLITLASSVHALRDYSRLVLRN